MTRDHHEPQPSQQPESEETPQAEAWDAEAIEEIEIEAIEVDVGEEEDEEADVAYEADEEGEEGEDEEDEIEMLVTDIVADQEEPVDGYLPITMLTNRGDIACHYYEVEDAPQAVIFVGSVSGAFDAPAHGLFPRLALELQTRGIASLQIALRDAADMEEALLDVLAGLGFCASEGVEALGLVGHALGGAVALQAATAAEEVRAVVTLATEEPGEDVIEELPEECALLLIHGEADERAPADISRGVYERAGEPRRLEVYAHAGHALDEAADTIFPLVRDWLVEHLSASQS